VESIGRQINAGAFRVVLAAFGLVLAIPVFAVWSEPSASSPNGPGSVPVRLNGIQTKAGSLDLQNGADITGPNTGTSGQVTSGLWGIGVRANETNRVSAGVLGRANSDRLPPCSDPWGSCPFYVGVAGAGINGAGNHYGVYGDNGGNSNAWAGYFFGTTFALGPVTVGSGGSLLDTGGASVGYGFTQPYPSSGGLGIVESYTGHTGKAAIAGLLTGANVAGYGISGILDPATFGSQTCPTIGIYAGCTGVLGSTVAGTAPMAPGRWAGHFNGNVRITGSLFVNGSPFGVSPSTATNELGSIQAIPSGARLGYAEVTGGSYDSKGGLVSDGQYLAVSQAPIEKALTRYLGGPFAVHDQPVSNKTIGRMNYDGQYYWGNLNSSPAGMWRFDGGSFAFASPNFASGYTGTDAQPYFDGTNVLLGLMNSGNLFLGKLIVATSATSEISLGLAGCSAPQFLTSDQTNYYVAVPPACGDTSTTRVIKLNSALAVTGAFDLGAYGVASGITYDGTDLWVVATLPTTVNVVQFKTDGTFVRAVDLGAISSASGFTGGPIVFDGTNLWASVSQFGASAEGKLYRVNRSTGTATFIDRAASGGTPYPKHPIWNLYFDGQYLWLSGYNSTAAPRVNWYLEKRKP
jgi:hypothetical protein